MKLSFTGFSHILLVAIAFLAASPTQANSIVVSYHPIATKIGEKVLAKGGNAYDAFISTTFAEYVLSEGVTSPSGPIAALTYHASTNEVSYLDGWFSDSLDPSAKWDDKQPILGKSILVPGAIRALSELNRRYGKLSWAECLKPAAALARSGFPMSALYAAIIKAEPYQAMLKGSDYAKNIYFNTDGTPLREGQILKLPAFADFLISLSKDRDYAYTGKWATSLTQLAQSLGGKISLRDFSEYRAVWRTPRKFTFLGNTLYSNSGRSYGSTWTNLALKTLENFHPEGKHFSSSAPDLEALIRVERMVSPEEWIYKASSLDDGDLVKQNVSSTYAEQLWKKAQSAAFPTQSSTPSGSHSYAVVAMDSAGNAIAGTHTINAMPFAKGLFVEGVPISDAGSLANEFYSVAPGQRRLDPLSMHMVFRDGHLKLAISSFNQTTVGEFEYLTNVLVYGMPVKNALEAPQFSATDYSSGTPVTFLSPRVDSKIVQALQSKGLGVKQAYQIGMIGLGTAVEVSSDGEMHGAIVPIRESLSENSPDREE